MRRRFFVLTASSTWPVPHDVQILPPDKKQEHWSRNGGGAPWPSREDNWTAPTHAEQPGKWQQHNILNISKQQRSK